MLYYLCEVFRLWDELVSILGVVYLGLQKAGGHDDGWLGGRSTETGGLGYANEDVVNCKHRIVVNGNS